MRLQLSHVALALALVATGGASARAQGAEEDERRSEATLRVYADDDRVTVVSPATSVVLPVGDDVVLGIDATMDAVTSASVDVITSASPTPFVERRLELGAGARWALTPTLSLTGGAIASHEQDHDSVRGTAGVRLDLAERNTRIDARYSHLREAFGATGQPTFAASRQSHSVVTTFSQVLGRRTIADLTIDGQLGDGYHASPYRTVPIVDPAQPASMIAGEATPARRLALATSARLRRALASAWFANVWYRYYADTWGIGSHTGSAEVRRTLGARTLVGLALRGYRQSAADFWAASYAMEAGAAPAYRTRDRTLAAMRSLYVSGSADVRLGAAAVAARLSAAVGIMSFWFLDSPTQARRTALITTLSLSLPF